MVSKPSVSELTDLNTIADRVKMTSIKFVYDVMHSKEFACKLNTKLKYDMHHTIISNAIKMIYVNKKPKREVLVLFESYAEDRGMKKYFLNCLASDNHEHFHDIVQSVNAAIIENIHTTETVKLPEIKTLLNFISSYVDYYGAYVLRYIIEDVFALYYKILEAYAVETSSNGVSCYRTYSMQFIGDMERKMFLDAVAVECLSHIIDSIKNFMTWREHAHTIKRIISLGAKAVNLAHLEPEVRIKYGICLVSAMILVPAPSTLLSIVDGYPVYGVLCQIIIGNQISCSLDLLSHVEDKLFVLFILAYLSGKIVVLHPSGHTLIDYLLNQFLYYSSSCGSTSCVILLSQSLGILKDKIENITEWEFQQIIDSLMVYMIHTINYSIDIVKHHTRELFEKVVLYGKGNQFISYKVENVTKLANRFDQNHRFLAVQYYATLCKCRAATFDNDECRSILVLIFYCIRRDLSNFIACVDLAKRLTELHVGQHISGEVLYRKWIHIFCNTRKISSNKRVRFFCDEVILFAVSLQPSVIHELLTEDICDYSIALRCVHYTRLRGITFSPNRDKWRDLILYETINKLVQSTDEEIRIWLLKSMVESKKAAEELSLFELNTLMTLYEKSISTQQPKIRQSIVYLFKKFFKRLQSCYRNAGKESGTINLSMGQLQEYNSKVKNFIDLLFRHITWARTNYSRRTVALELLHFIATELRMHAQWVDTVDEDKIRNLMCLLLDNYDNNKALAFELLTYYHTIRPCFAKTSQFTKFHQWANDAVFSRDTNILLSSPYMYKLLTLSKYSRKNKNCSSSLVVLRFLLKMLDITYDRNIAHFDTRKQLYGLLMSIRTLILDFKCDDAYGYDIVEIFKPTVELCLKMKDHVTMFVCSDFPEGYVFSADIASDVEKSGQECRKQLLYAWRTLTEIIHLLACLIKSSINLSSKYPEKSIYLLDKNEITVICQFLIDTILKTKHRGVFEQAHDALSTVCETFFGVIDEFYSTLPLKWLDNAIDMCSSTDCKDLELCATRRSAGFPFFVLSVLKSEPSKQRPLLSKAIDRFWMIAANGPPTEINCESIAHALNVLRAIFLCAKWGEIVLASIDKVGITTLEAIQSSIWGVRNAATLLFSALILRLFGVQRTRLTTGLLKNKMSLVVFSIKHKILFEYILGVLRSSPNISSRIIQPILLILSRLAASYKEDLHELYDIYNHIQAFRLCANYDTRVLVSKAELSLTSRQENNLLSNFSKTAASFLLNGNAVDNNHCHGVLFEIWSKMFNMTKSNVKYLMDVIDMTKYLHILNDTKYSALCKTYLMDILCVLVVKGTSSMTVEPLKLILIAALQSKYTTVANNWRNHFYWSRLLLLMSLLLVRFKYNRNNYSVIANELRCILNSNVVQAQQKCLHFLILLQHYCYPQTVNLCNHFLIVFEQIEFDRMMHTILGKMDMRTRYKLLKLCHTNLCAFIKRHLNEDSINDCKEIAPLIYLSAIWNPCVFIEQATNIRSKLSIIMRLIRQCEHEKSIASLLNWLAVQLVEYGMEISEDEILYSVLVLMGNLVEEMISVDIRMSLAQLLSYFYSTYTTPNRLLKGINLCRLSNITLTLLQDDEILVRNRVQEIIQQHIRQENSLNLQSPMAQIFTYTKQHLSEHAAICFLVHWSCREVVYCDENEDSDLLVESEFNKYIDNYEAATIANRMLKEIISDGSIVATTNEKRINIVKKLLAIDFNWADMINIELQISIITCLLLLRHCLQQGEPTNVMDCSVLVNQVLPRTSAIFSADRRYVLLKCFLCEILS